MSKQDKTIIRWIAVVALLGLLWALLELAIWLSEVTEVPLIIIAVLFLAAIGAVLKYFFDKAVGKEDPSEW